MKLGATIAGGIVTNVILLDDDADPANFDVIEVPADVEIGWYYQGGVLAPPPPPAPEPVTAGDLKAYSAQVRYAKETAGITVAGSEIRTDRQSQALIMGAHLMAQINPLATFKFKTAAGFATLDATQMTAIALAVAAHVQTCFALEADVEAAILDQTITDFAGIDAAYSI